MDLRFLLVSSMLTLGQCASLQDIFGDSVDLDNASGGTQGSPRAGGQFNPQNIEDLSTFGGATLSALIDAVNVKPSPPPIAPSPPPPIPSPSPPGPVVIATNSQVTVPIGTRAVCLEPGLSPIILFQTSTTVTLTCIIPTRPPPPSPPPPSPVSPPPPPPPVPSPPPPPPVPSPPPPPPVPSPPPPPTVPPPPPPPTTVVLKECQTFTVATTDRSKFTVICPFGPEKEAAVQNGLTRVLCIQQVSQTGTVDQFQQIFNGGQALQTTNQDILTAQVVTADDVFSVYCTDLQIPTSGTLETPSGNPAINLTSRCKFIANGAGLGTFSNITCPPASNVLGVV